MLTTSTRFKIKPLIAALCFSPSLLLADNALQPIVVTANNVEQNQRTITSKNHIISAQEIADKQYQTLTDALSSVPGLSGYNNGGLGTSSSVFLRGLDSKNTLVMIDGIIQNEPSGLSGANFNHLLMDNIERIEIIKGPQSGVWGADAVAGVINIITKPSTDQTTVNVSAERGSNNYQKLATQLGAGNEQVDFLVSFANTQSDSFSAIKPYKQTEKDFENDPFDQTDIGFKLGININPHHRVETNLLHSTSHTSYDGTSDDTTNNILAPNLINNIDYTNKTQQLRYQGTLDHIDLKAYLQQTEIERKNFNDGQATFHADSTVKQYGMGAGYRYLNNQQVNLSLDRKELTNRINGETITNNAVGLTNTNLFNNDQFIVTQALRSESFDAFDDKITGKLGVKNFFNDSTYLSANIGTAYRAPTINESQYSSVQPETSEAFDINFGWRGLTLTYFEQKTDDKIEFDSVNSDFANAIYRYKNVTGESTFKGLDLTYQQTLDAINTDFNFSYSQLSAKDSNNEWFARRPEQQASLSIDFYGLNNTRLGLDSHYTGTNYDKANKQGAQIGEYLVHNLTADYQMTQHISLFAKVQNVFDKDFTNAVAAYESDKMTPKYVYSTGGRMLYLGIKAKL